MLKKRRRGLKGEPSPGVPPLRAAPAARSQCYTITPAVIPLRSWVEPRPYRGLEEHGEVGGDRSGGTSRTPSPTGRLRRRGVRGHPTPGGGGTPPLRGSAERGGAGGEPGNGSSRTPTPTAGGKRHVCRIICREIIPRPGGGKVGGARESGTSGTPSHTGRLRAVHMSETVNSRRTTSRFQSKKRPLWRRFSLSKKALPSSTKGIALRSAPRLSAKGGQFDTPLREKYFRRRTCRRRK